VSGLDRRRIAQQQAALRVVNNAIATGRAGTGADLIPVLCECGEVGCNTLIEIGHQDYREVRGDPRRFVVRAGHDVDGVDTVVGRCPGGAVVVEAGPDLASEVT
jgi:hypothetical protein